MNRLQYEKSPYLKQHQDNPVDWYPWGEEALNKAKSEDKLILVSIGYSSCHWCHVMAHECFENPQLAAIMNEHFVNIKVDREERPDIDAIYMDALHAMGVRGGWPLNVFLMPDAKPFYGGTYFPPQNWQNILLGTQNAFKTDREKLQVSAESFARSLNTKESEKVSLFDLGAVQSEKWNAEEVEYIYERLSSQFDPERGGFMRAPKFPMPSVWKFLLEAQAKHPDFGIREHLKLTLDRIALGGIYDHLGGGWTRYSTDAEWKVPHFEKMLYDNGQLIELYSQAYDYFNKQNLHPESRELYKWAVYKAIEWLKREMQSEEGGFYSALDADSEGEEGKYYVWFKEEIDSILKEESETFNSIYKITQQGNWEHGNNVIHLDELPVSKEWIILKQNHDKLLKARENRIRPGLDDKLICSWNALLLSGLIKSAQVFEDENLIDLSRNLAEFILREFSLTSQNDEGKVALSLNHVKSEGHSSEIFGFLDDYSTIIKALTELYQLTFEEYWLEKAVLLADYVLHNFFDTEEGLFFFTDSQSEKLIARKKEVYDNVIPASNSILANALYDLGVLTSDDNLMEMGISMFAKTKKITSEEPGYMSNWATLGLKLSAPEVVIAGPEAFKVKREINKQVVNPVYYAGATESSKLALLQGRIKTGNETYIYVCKNRTCQLPVTDVKEALKAINEL